MPKRNNKLTKSLREIGQIHVNDWELPEFLTKDISELEVSKAMQRLGNIRVTDWDLKDVIPTLQKLAQREIDIVGMLKRAAEYRVNEWDIRESLLRSRAKQKKLSQQEIQLIGRKLHNFLRYMVDHLVDEPQYATIEIDEIAPKVMRCRIILKQRDLSMLIGMNGYTAAPLRRLVKDTALQSGAYCLLQILTHEEAEKSKS